MKSIEDLHIEILRHQERIKELYLDIEKILNKAEPKTIPAIRKYNGKGFSFHKGCGKEYKGFPCGYISSTGIKLCPICNKK